VHFLRYNQENTHVIYNSPYTTATTSSSSITKTTEQENEALARRYHMDIFQKGKLEVADEIISPDFVLRNPILPVQVRYGPAGTKEFASATIAAVP
jgi:hypothetical protein